MNSAESALAAALQERLALIADEASRQDQARHLARLQSVSEKIERLSAQLPQPIDPRLAHYLTRCSYEKALQLLEGKL